MSQNNVTGIFTRTNPIHGSEDNTVFIVNGEIVKSQAEYEFKIAYNELENLIGKEVDNFYYRGIPTKEITKSIIDLIRFNQKEISEILKRICIDWEGRKTITEENGGL